MHATTIPVEIKVTNPDLHRFGGLPRRGTPGAAAVDLVALAVYAKKADGKPDLSRKEPIDGHVLVPPGEVAFIDVGFSMHIKQSGWAALLLPRSSASVVGLAMGNTVGLLDKDYVGPPIVAVKDAKDPRTSNGLLVGLGERIAQLVFVPVAVAEWTEVEEFSETTERGVGGFGSTGR